MKKGQKTLLALIGFIWVLTACSNEKSVEQNPGSVPPNTGIQSENKEGQNVSEDISSMLASDREELVSEKNESEHPSIQEAENRQPEPIDGYPSNAEIVAALESEKANSYWLAPNPTVPDVYKTLNAETDNMEILWDTILDRVFENTNMTEEAMPDEYRNQRYQFSWNNQSWNVEISEYSIGLRSDASIDEDIRDSILDILTERTGMGVSFETGEINHYAFTYNGFTLDEYGYSPGGDEWMPESVVSLDDDRIFICNPIVIQGDCERFGAETLLSVDTARTIYDAYRMSSGITAVSVISDVELVYYFRDGQLLPAWRLAGQIFFSGPNGHDMAALLDAVSGEIIRSS